MAINPTAANHFNQGLPDDNHQDSLIGPDSSFGKGRPTNFADSSTTRIAQAESGHQTDALPVNKAASSPDSFTDGFLDQAAGIPRYFESLYNRPGPTIRETLKGAAEGGFEFLSDPSGHMVGIVGTPIWNYMENPTNDQIGRSVFDGLFNIGAGAATYGAGRALNGLLPDDIPNAAKPDVDVSRPPTELRQQDLGEELNAGTAKSIRRIDKDWLVAVIKEDGVGPTSPGQQKEHLSNEMKNLNKLKDKGFPVVENGGLVEIIGDEKNPDTHGLLIREISDAISSETDRARFIENMTPESEKQLREVEQMLKREELFVDELQFLMDPVSGKVVINDPVDVLPDVSLPGDTRTQVSSILEGYQERVKPTKLNAVGGTVLPGLAATNDLSSTSGGNGTDKTLQSPPLPTDKLTEDVHRPKLKPEQNGESEPAIGPRLLAPETDVYGPPAPPKKAEWSGDTKTERSGMNDFGQNSGLLQSFKNGASNVANDFKNTFSDVAGGAANTFSNAMGSIRDAGASMWNSFTSTVGSWFGGSDW